MAGSDEECTSNLEALQLARRSNLSSPRIGNKDWSNTSDYINLAEPHHEWQIVSSEVANTPLPPLTTNPHRIGVDIIL